MPGPALDFSGRAVVVTGGTGGIGLGLARGFAEAGASVVATGATEAEVAAAGAVGVDFVVLDVRSDAAVAAFAASASKVDVLVNCAGVNLRAAEFTTEGFETVVDINLTGSMRMATALHDGLAAAGGGAILNIASVYAVFGAPHAPAYSASKGGVAQLTKSLAVAWAKENIRVNALAPGWIETTMTAAPRANPARNAELMGRTPMGRWGAPADLVGPALFLCSPLAGFVTGAVLPVDGGFMVM